MSNKNVVHKPLFTEICNEVSVPTGKHRSHPTVMALVTTSIF